MDLPTLAFERLKSSLLRATCGPASILMYAGGPELAYSVNAPRYRDIPQHHLSHSPPPTLVLTECTSTMSDLCHPQKVTGTC